MRTRLVLGLQLVLLAAIVAAWQYGPGDASLFSRPSVVARRVVELWNGVVGMAPLWRQVTETLGATLVGHAAGVGAGYAAGVVLGEFQTLHRGIAPYLEALNAVPRVAWVPLLTMVFGFGLLTEVIMSALIVFLVVFFNVLDACTNAPEAWLRNVRALGGGAWAAMRDVRAWVGVGALVAALPNAIAFALVGVVFAESLAAESGLGALMFNAMHTGNAADLMVSAGMLALIGVVLAVIVQRLQRALARRLPPEFAETDAT
jgi:ABC-type nitrate/sulfonate/bicarbonate transport system permease component